MPFRTLHGDSGTLPGQIGTFSLFVVPEGFVAVLREGVTGNGRTFRIVRMERGQDGDNPLLFQEAVVSLGVVIQPTLAGLDSLPGTVRNETATERISGPG